MTSIAVLGAGPAGLLAAHAATLNGHEVTIYSKKRKSYMRGAQYLHLPIPEAPAQSFEISYQLDGPADGYRDKVYGASSGVSVSPEYLVGTSTAWDMRAVYDHLWARYERQIQDFNIGPLGLEDLLQDYHPKAVISTIPRKAICANGDHVFSGTTVYVTEESYTTNNTVVCSGHIKDKWYRTSTIQGWQNTEFARYDDALRSLIWGNKVHQVVKPVSTDCDCFPEINFAGRYGTWTKGVLAHSAFYDTVNELQHGRMQEQNQ